MENNSNGSNEQYQILEKQNQELLELVESLDQELENTRSKIAQIQHTVEKIVQLSFSNEFKYDLDYISLYQCLKGEESYQVKRLPYDIENKYRATGTAPTLEEYHMELLKRLNIADNDKVNYPLELSVNMLKELRDPVYMNLFTFLDKTLED